MISDVTSTFAIATNTALKGMLEFLKEHAEELKKEA